MICPDCHWITPTRPYRLRQNGIYVYSEREALPVNYYPKILELYIDWKGRKVYREVHKCPNCLFEFEQTIIEG